MARTYPRYGAHMRNAVLAEARGALAIGAVGAADKIGGRGYAPHRA